MLQRVPILLAMTACAGAQTLIEHQQRVRDTEIAFARTMADRNFAAFQTFLAPDSIFFTGGPKRGVKAIAQAWKAFYDGPKAPFSWAPDSVEVNDAGTLAMSSGPVWDPSGKRTGTFNSIWRREPDGKWRVIFDKGCPPCADCAPREDAGKRPEPLAKLYAGPARCILSNSTSERLGLRM